VPETDDIALADGSVNLTATMLYADLADSTEMAMHDLKMASKVYKCFLATCSRIIRSSGGQIRSFDGDRVMAIFLGDHKNTNAAKCGLKINYAFLKILKPKFEAKYNVLKNGTIKLAHCVGIDTSEIMVVRGGIRNNNDLLWVGRAPNIAAKFSSVRNSPYHTYITGIVYNSMNDSSKSFENKNMWNKVTGSLHGISEAYASSWTWTL
jgi:class 3 adenylate cyclase